jgi:hypothetical protein
MRRPRSQSGRARGPNRQRFEILIPRLGNGVGPMATGCRTQWQDDRPSIVDALLSRSRMPSSGGLMSSQDVVPVVARI